jgi:hypothetical protein
MKLEPVLGRLSMGSRRCFDGPDDCSTPRNIRKLRIDIVDYPTRNNLTENIVRCVDIVVFLKSFEKRGKQRMFHEMKRTLGVKT